VRLSFALLPGRCAIARLDESAPFPQWPRGAFVSATRAPGELSIVCDEESVPEGVRADRGWRCLALQGPFPLDTTGMAAAFTSVLAAAGVSVFVIATFDTDYVLVRDSALARATEALRAAGHTVG